MRSRSAIIAIFLAFWFWGDSFVWKDGSRRDLSIPIPDASLGLLFPLTFLVVLFKWPRSLIFRVFVVLALHVMFWMIVFQCETMSYEELSYQVTVGALVTSFAVWWFASVAARGDQALASEQQSQED